MGEQTEYLALVKFSILYKKAAAMMLSYWHLATTYSDRQERHCFMFDGVKGLFFVFCFSDSCFGFKKYYVSDCQRSESSDITRPLGSRSRVRAKCSFPQCWAFSSPCPSPTAQRFSPANTSFLTWEYRSPTSEVVSLSLHEQLRSFL